MTALIAWVVTHGPEVIGVLLAIHGAAVAIVNLTPTPKDDEYVSKYYRVIEVLAGIVTRLSKT